jgi:hypothetical protein
VKLSLRVCTVPSFVLPVRYSFSKLSCLVQELRRQICGHHFKGRQESQKGSKSQCTLIITCPIYQLHPSKLLPKVTSDAFHTIAMTTAIFGNHQHATGLEGESTQRNIIIIQMKGQLSSTYATVSRNKDWLMTSYSHDNAVATL